MQGCIYCNRIFGHDCRCPMYKSPTPLSYCSHCGEGIFEGEEYIENDEGEQAHWDCVSYGRDLVKFLGYEIKEMRR